MFNKFSNVYLFIFNFCLKQFCSSLLFRILLSFSFFVCSRKIRKIFLFAGFFSFLRFFIQLLLLLFNPLCFLFLYLQLKENFYQLLVFYSAFSFCVCMCLIFATISNSNIYLQQQKKNLVFFLICFYCFKKIQLI